MAKFTADPLTNLTANETSTINTINENFERIEEALEQTLSRDGTVPNTMNATLDMNSQRIVHLRAAVNPTEPVRKAEFDAAVFGTGESDFSTIYKDMLDALVTANPIESQFGGVGDGTTDDTTAVQAAVDFVIAAGGGTVLLTHAHRITAPITNTTNVPIVISGNIPEVSKLVVDFTEAAYPTGAAAIDFSYDESYNNNSVVIQNVGFYLSTTSGQRLNTAIKVHYAARLNPSGSVIIQNCRVDKVGSIYWLKGIDIDTAPQARIFDNIIFAGGGGLTVLKTGYGIQLGQYAQGTMIHRNSIRGMEFGIYCSSDSVDDPTQFQAEGVSIRGNKAQSCDWGVGVFLSENEIAWSFTDNDFDCGNGGFWIRNLLRFQMSNNTDGWNNKTQDHCGVLLEYDSGTEGDYELKGIQGQIRNGYSLRRGDIDYDLVDVVKGATTEIEWSETSAAKTVTAASVDGDGAITLVLNNTTLLRNGRKVLLTGFTDSGWTTLNGNTYRIGDIDVTAKTVRIYTEDDRELLVDGTGFAGWTSGGSLALVYSTGTLVNGDKIWIDRTGGAVEINDSPYIVQDVDTLNKTARLTSYYDGSDIDSSSWGDWTKEGNITRYSRAVEVRGGKFLSINGLQVFERNVALHLWPETSEITFKNPMLIRTGPNQALGVLNLSNYPETIYSDDEDEVNDGNAVGDGIADDTAALQSVFDNGESIRLRADKTYLITSSLIPRVNNQGVYGNNALIWMSPATDHFDNTTYAGTPINKLGRYGYDAVGFMVDNLSGFFMRDLRMSLTEWEDLVQLKAASFYQCDYIDIDRCEFFNFSRGKGVLSFNDCGDGTNDLKIPAGKITNSDFHTLYTNSASGTSQERQVTAVDVDSDCTSGTYGLLIDNCTFMNITNSYTSIGGTEANYQADAIQLAGLGTTKPSRCNRVTNCTFYNTGDGVDIFGDENIVSNNHFERIFGWAVKLSAGASKNKVMDNIIKNGGLGGIVVQGGTVVSVNCADNEIYNNTVDGFEIAGDWTNADGNLSWDATAAARAAWSASTTIGISLDAATNSATCVPTGTVVKSNIVDGKTLGNFGIRHSTHTVGTESHIVENNKVINCASANYGDFYNYMKIDDRPVTKTGDFTVSSYINDYIVNKGSSCTVTLPSAATNYGRKLSFTTIQAFTVVSASSNVVPRVGGSAGTAILSATDGAWCDMVSDGTNWIIVRGS